MSNFVCRRLSAAVLILLCVTQQVAVSNPITRVLTVTGEAASDGNGYIAYLGDPVINDAGQVVFSATLEGTSDGFDSNLALYLFDGAVGPVRIARKGQYLPGVDATIPQLYTRRAVLNRTGQAPLYISLADPDGSVGDDGIYVTDSIGGIVQIASEGQPPPDGNGVFTSFASDIDINDAGRVVFWNRLFRTANGIVDQEGIFYGDGIHPLTQVVRTGTAAPDGNGYMSYLSQSPYINNTGQVAYHAKLKGTQQRGVDDTGLYISDGTGNTIEVARRGQAAPDGNGTIDGFTFMPEAFSDTGQVTYIVEFTGTTGGYRDNLGLFLGDGLSAPVQIARLGQDAPDGNGVFMEFSPPVLSNGGQVAFTGRLTDTQAGSDDDRGIYLHDDGTPLIQIVREGQAVPNGNGFFNSFSTPAINEMGQVAFVSGLTGTQGGINDSKGIFFYDPQLGMIQVARAGDVLLDSTVISVGFGFQAVDEEISMNASGQIAFDFTLADGRGGVALWSVPEPASLVIFSLVATFILDQRKSDRRNGAAGGSC
jgi:hypothetical protein